MPSSHPVSLYLLHVPLGGALALPVATGLAGGAEQQGGQLVYPLRGGDGAGRHRRGRRCGAQPVIPPQHRPQHPRVLPSAPRLSFSLPFCRCHPLDAPFIAELPFLRLPPLLLRVFLFSSHPSVTPFLFEGGGRATSLGNPRYGASCRDARCRRTVRSSADVASPRLDVDDDVDVHARSPARDAGAYHDIEPKRISDVRQLRLKFEISIG